MSTELESVHSRKNPFSARMLVNRNLTGAGSNKETRHFEISLEGSGLKYEAGDALGVFPSNPPELVALVLEELGFSGEEVVTTPDGHPATIRAALAESYALTGPSKQFLQAVAERDSQFPAGFFEPAGKADLEKFLWGRDVPDVLQEYPAARFTPEEFVKVLRKLQPRLYSVASSQEAVGDSVHLTVAVVRYGVGHSGRPRVGVCSSFLADRAGDGVPSFVHTARHFRLPEDPDTPIIMVGPGTGIAPFRAFLQERSVRAVTGASWLIFGEQHAASDFLYRDELESAVADGRLTKLTTAFSRDQPEKIYVQHRISEQGAEVFDWLERGAYFYVCGDAKNMAKDVEAALHNVVEKFGKKSAEAAREYIETMKKEKRYRKDVY